VNQLIQDLEERFTKFNDGIQEERRVLSEDSEALMTATPFTKFILTPGNKDACHILTGFSVRNFEVLYDLLDEDLKVTHRGKARYISPKDSLMLFLSLIRNYPTIDIMSNQFSEECKP
jgi:hypothetical protein